MEHKNEPSRTSEQPEDSVLMRAKKQCIALAGIVPAPKPIDIEKIPVTLFANALSFLGVWNVMTVLSAARRREFTGLPDQHNVQRYQQWLQSQSSLRFGYQEMNLCQADEKGETPHLQRFVQATVTRIRSIIFEATRSGLPSAATLNLMINRTPRLDHLAIHFDYNDSFGVGMLAGLDRVRDALLAPDNECDMTQTIRQFEMVGQLRLIELPVGMQNMAERKRFAENLEVLNVVVRRGGTRFWKKMLQADTPVWPRLRCLTMKTHWSKTDLPKLANKTPVLETLSLTDDNVRHDAVDCLTTFTAFRAFFLACAATLRSVKLMKSSRTVQTIWFDKVCCTVPETLEVDTKTETRPNTWNAEISAGLWNKEDQQAVQNYMEELLGHGTVSNYGELSLSLLTDSLDALYRLVKIGVKAGSLSLALDGETSLQSRTVLKSCYDLFPSLSSLNMKATNQQFGVDRVKGRLNLWRSTLESDDEELIQELVERKMVFTEIHIGRTKTARELESLLIRLWITFPGIKHISQSYDIQDIEEGPWFTHVDTVPGYPVTFYGEQKKSPSTVETVSGSKLLSGLETVKLQTLSLWHVPIHCPPNFFPTLAKLCPNLVNLCLFTRDPIYASDVLAFQGLERLRLWSSVPRQERQTFSEAKAEAKTGHPLISNATLQQVCKLNPKLQVLFLEILETDIIDLGNSDDYPITGSSLLSVAFCTQSAFIRPQQIVHILRHCPRLKRLSILLNDKQRRTQGGHFVRLEHEMVRRFLQDIQQLHFLELFWRHDIVPREYSNSWIKKADPGRS